MSMFVGYSEYYHDGAIASITQDGVVEFASQAERYSKKKNDAIIPDSLWDLVVKDDDHISFYEDQALKLRSRFTTDNHKKNRNRAKRLMACHAEIPITGSNSYDVCYPHHMSHVAAAFFTRPWDSKDDTVLVSIDGIGEVQSATIYNSNFELIWEMHWPKSVGVPYSAVTKDLKLRPLEDEYVVMGLSSYGQPTHADLFIKWFDQTSSESSLYNQGKPVDNDEDPRVQSYNLFRSRILELSTTIPREDLAASVQKFAEYSIMSIMKQARKHGSKLVYGGGCAQNVVVNSMIHKMFDQVHIAIAPTDAGSSLGAAALSWHKATGKDKLIWTPYSGHNIEGELNPKEVVDYLLEHKVCGIANGRAEFGPRALGNRSLIADVRYDVQDTVNEIKRRQKYRPFAPAILEEFAEEYFEGPMNEYMQYTSKALHDYKSVTHVDGTARVQILKKDCTSVFRKIVEEYYERTGVPMLLNTSLNIRGRPMVNDDHDARLFEQEYGVKVFY